jgi:hypothetical protein
MASDRIVSINEAAKLRGQSKEGIVKAIHTGRLYSYQLSGKGHMLSARQVLGKTFDEVAFKKLCQQYVSVPEACNIVWKTDAAVMRDLRKGVIKGFKLNHKCWVVLRSSAEQEFRDYLEAHKGRVGRKRSIGEDRSPRKKPLKNK